MTLEIEIECLANEKWAAQLRKGTLELAILGSLWDAPRYGLEILQIMEEGGLASADSTVYPILNRLRNDGLLASEWRHEGSGNPRKYYTLTPMGRTRTQGIAREWQSFSTALGRILRSVPLPEVHA